MTRLKLYKVSADYLDSIREIEPKVSLLKERRPFLGILITIDSNNYELKMPTKGKELISLSDLKRMEENIIKPFYNKLFKKIK